jgi:drug/metabolite transporter (DMT)-like permease
VESSKFAYAVLACAALFWAGNFIAGRALAGVVDPVALNFWRWFLALLILLPVTGRQLYENFHPLRRDWSIILGLGATGIALFHILVYAALIRTTAVNALLIVSTAPVVIVLLSWAIFRDGIAASQALGIGISLLGASILILHGELERLFSLQLGTGELLVFAAVVVWGGYSVLLKRRPADVPAASVLTATILVALVLMLPIYLWNPTPVPLTAPVLGAVLYISVFASVLGFLFWNKGVAVVGPNRAGVFLHLMPVFGVGLSILLLGETIAPYQVVGAGLVVVGIIATSRAVAR